MTEHFPGAPGDRPEGPDERASAGTGQPTDQPPLGREQAAQPGTSEATAPQDPVARPEAAAWEPTAPAAGQSPPAVGGPGPVTGRDANVPGVQPGPPSPWAPAGYSHYGADVPAQQHFGQPGQTHPTQQQAGYQPAGAQPGGYAGYPPPSGPPTGPIMPGYPGGGPQPQRRRLSGLVAGVAVLALVVGGVAGGLGGYLVSSRNDGSSTVMSSLNQPVPAGQSANAPAGSVQSVAAQMLPVVVEIAAESQSQGDTGSGFIISSDGDILTNNHVIASAVTGGRIQVIFANGKQVDATVVGRDPTSDIAVIKAQGVTGLPVAQLGQSTDLQVGQPVVAIGAPFQLSGTVTSGIVSSLHRPTAAGDGTQSSQQTVLDAIQTDAPINPGNSGGPLVDMQSHVIGINSAIYSPNSGGGPQASQGGNVGIGFAIPIDQARRTADQIVKTGKATQTVLGVQVTDNTPTSGGQPSILPNGAQITKVTPGGPADKGGLKTGAVVVKSNDRAVTTADGLVAAVHAAAPGDQMKLTLSDGSTVTVTLSGQPVSVN